MEIFDLALQTYLYQTLNLFVQSIGDEEKSFSALNAHIILGCLSSPGENTQAYLFKVSVMKDMVISVTLTANIRLGWSGNPFQTL